MMDRKEHAWQDWAEKAVATEPKIGVSRRRFLREKRSKRKKTLREPSGLCRWRHHDLCTLNSVSMLNGELIGHAVDLEFAIAREEADIRNVHVYHLDQVIKELWFLRSRMATYAARNGSPVDERACRLFPSVMALLDEAIRVRKGYASE